VHGGGWVIGDKKEQALPLMYRMAARGWVCVSVNYPLSPRARWPEHIVALKTAVAWIRSSIAQYGGDPNFVAVTGGSAGGHLAALLALTPHVREFQPGFEDVDTSLQACVPHYGVYDFTAESGHKYTKDRLDSLLRRMVMAPDAVYPDDYRGASPLYRMAELEPDEIPPFLVLHGSHDTLVPVIEAREFVSRLRERSANPVAYAEIQGAQHAFDIFTSIRSAHVVKGVERFLDWSYATRLNRAATRGSAQQPA
jgi:acetyl esterase/lipase